MPAASESYPIVRQLGQRLASLAAAGVEFFPRAGPLHFAPAEDEPEPEPVPDAAAMRRLALETLTAEVAGCSRCPSLFSTRTNTVFGVGPLGAELCFVGEAPGADEDRTGEPFVGAAGQLLNKIIAACGFERDEVYICNTVKCRPPNNREPTPDERANCRGFFERQLELVKPKVICCLGGVAAKSVLGTPVGIMKLRGKWHEFKGVPVMCTYHPAYLLRQQGPAQLKAKAECWDDMKAVLKRLGREVPGAK